MCYGVSMTAMRWRHIIMEVLFGFVGELTFGNVATREKRVTELFEFMDSLDAP